MSKQICSVCGHDTTYIDMDYLSGTDHLHCVVLRELRENPVEKCVLCGDITPYRYNDHIDCRYGYVQGLGQLCKNCYNGKDNSDLIIPKSLIENTPNDQTLGERVRAIYWGSSK